MTDRAAAAGRLLVVATGALVAAVVGWIVFYEIPGSLADLIGILLVVGVVLLGVRVAGDYARAAFPDYNVGEVAVEGPITRDGGSPGPVPSSVVGAPAEDLVDQIEAADEDDNVRALLVKLNTPGGQVVPSDDVRRAVAAFDGPTVAYTTDTCASGGYWIASGCDELWAHEASIVGSIGVIGSRVNVAELADDLGVSYERFAAGEYKDAGVPLRELSEDERDYLQGIVDEFYDDFVERVAEGREMDPETIRDTEARIYLGETARDVGLVDELGSRDDVEESLEARLDEAVSVREFTPSRGLATRLRGGGQSLAYAFGAGLASAFDDDAEFRFRF
ncbi:MAG: signal peptide peptidase SppA [Haloferacaceae archaeon]